MPNICIFGDSITWGADDVEKGGWAERLKSHYMGNGGIIDIYNLGISGDNTNGLLARFEGEAQVREPDCVIFAIGINDSQYILDKDHYRVPVLQFEKNIAALLAQAKRIAKEVICIGLTQVDEEKTMPVAWSNEKFYDNESIASYNRVLEQSCVNEKLQYINLTGVFNVADFGDGLHPDPASHQKIFEIVKGTVDELFKVS